MPTAMQLHYHERKHHSLFDLIPEAYRETVKFTLLVQTGIAALVLFLLLGQSM